MLDSFIMTYVTGYAAPLISCDGGGGRDRGSILSPTLVEKSNLADLPKLGDWSVSPQYCLHFLFHILRLTPQTLSDEKHDNNVHLYLIEISLRFAALHTAVVVVNPTHLIHVAQGDHPRAEELDHLPLDVLAEFPDVKLQVREIVQKKLVVVPLREVVAMAAADAARQELRPFIPAHRQRCTWKAAGARRKKARTPGGAFFRCSYC